MSTTTRHRQAKECLALLRTLVNDDLAAHFSHPDQAETPYWQAADLQVIPNESHERADAFAAHQMVIFTRHAETLGWLLYRFRDILADYLTADNKSLVYGQLGLALRRAQAGCDGASPKPLQLALLDAADLALEAFAEAERMRSRRRGRRSGD